MVHFYTLGIIITDLHFVPVHLPTLDISYKWNHNNCPFVSCVMWHNVFKAQPCGSMDQHLIAFHDQIVFHCMDTLLSIDGHLGCFHFGLNCD